MTSNQKHEKVVKDVKYSKKEPMVPDGGWGWVVCFAAACTNLTVSGLTTSGGMFLIGLRTIFDNPVRILALVGALHDGLSMIAAPVASVLLIRFSHRTVMIIASLLGFVGAVLGAVSSNIEMMIGTYGLLTGISLGMSFFTGQVITGQYFDKKRALAIGICNCGGGLGTMLINILFESLLEIYGLRGTLLLVAGLLLNIAVYGALCRPLPSTYTAAKKAYIDETDQPKAMELPSVTPESSNSGDINKKEQINEAFDISDEKQNSDSPLPADTSSIKDETVVNRHRIHRDSDVERCLISCGAEHFRNIDFVLLLLTYMAWVCSSALSIFIPPMCVWSFGTSQKTSAIILILVGAFATVGELLLGVFVDVFHFKSNKVFMCSLSVTTVCAALFPYCNQFILTATTASVFGFALGFGVSLRLILTTEIVGLEESTKAFSILSFFCGIGYLIAPPMFGLIYDVTESFVIVFYAGGICSFTALVLMILINFRNVCCGKSKRR